MGRSENIVMLSRRDLAVIHLIEQRIADEMERVKGLRVSASRRLLFIDLPTVNYLWRKDSSNGVVSPLNEFFEAHGRFENSFVSPNQTSRIAKLLRDIGLFYSKDRPEEAEMLGDEYALVPKPACDTLYEQLIGKYGDDPLEWPVSVPFDVGTGRALWDQAAHLPKPVFLTQKPQSV